MAFYLVLGFLILATIVLTVYLNTVLQEGRGTRALTREIKARSVADSTISRIASLINQRPFEERFYLVWAMAHGRPQPAYLFDSEVADRFPIFEFADFKGLGVELRGKVQDASVPQKLTRVKLEVVHDGYVLRSVYDVRFSEGLLGALNRESVITVKDLPDLPDIASDDVDLRMDAVKREANRPEKVAADPEDQVRVRDVQKTREDEPADLAGFGGKPVLAGLNPPTLANTPPDASAGTVDQLGGALPAGSPQRWSMADREKAKAAAAADISASMGPLVGTQAAGGMNEPLAGFSVETMRWFDLAEVGVGPPDPIPPLLRARHAPGLAATVLMHFPATVVNGQVVKPAWDHRVAFTYGIDGDRLVAIARPGGGLVPSYGNSVMARQPPPPVTPPPGP